MSDHVFARRMMLRLGCGSCLYDSISRITALQCPLPISTAVWAYNLSTKSAPAAIPPSRYRSRPIPPAQQTWLPYHLAPYLHGISRTSARLLRSSHTGVMRTALSLAQTMLAPASTSMSSITRMTWVCCMPAYSGLLSVVYSSYGLLVAASFRICAQIISQRNQENNHYHLEAAHTVSEAPSRRTLVDISSRTSHGLSLAGQQACKFLSSLFSQAT